MMADVGKDVEELNIALAAMAERAASDPDYREALQANQVEALRGAGVSALGLAGVFAELGADEDEVASYGMRMPGIGFASADGGEDPSKLIVNTLCIGTCIRQTITITVGCTRTV